MKKCKNSNIDWLLLSDEEKEEQDRKYWSNGRVFLVYKDSISDMTSSTYRVMKDQNLDRIKAVEYITNVCQANKGIIVYSIDELMKNID